MWLTVCGSYRIFLLVSKLATLSTVSLSVSVVRLGKERFFHYTVAALHYSSNLNWESTLTRARQFLVQHGSKPPLSISIISKSSIYRKYVATWTYLIVWIALVHQRKRCYRAYPPAFYSVPQFSFVFEIYEFSEEGGNGFKGSFWYKSNVRRPRYK